ncbi:MAG: hypothetical protein ACK4N5_00300, partial [Myxococcales bacterium]
MRLLLASTLLAGCADSHLVGARGEVAVEPAELTFEHTWVGHPSTATLLLQNTGRSPQAVAITIDGPFQISEAPTELAGAARHELRVTFAPPEAGSFEGAVRIAHAGGTFTVPLHGTAEVPPPCG